ncbi:MAG: acyl-CoA dehydrogenase family protein [Chloroflexi bacterium]|nr:acyl-CoA dehydrogenase family protein [Chloroflexota bacterium]
MDFYFSAEDEAFRQEVRAFLRQELPADWSGFQSDDAYASDEHYQLVRQFRKKLADQGWLTMAWPPEYGGQGASIWRQVVFNEEIGYAQAPYQAPMGVSWVGPALMLYGTEEQKRQFLPAIARDEIEFCTLYTEPGAGSDLAALQTSAVEDGDDFVVNGQKIFTSGAHHSDYGWLAARTDPQAPKHRDISTFIIDMKTPGITISPLINMVGVHAQNQVFFDDVRIPKSALVGERNRGWYNVAVALDFERSSIATVADLARVLEELIAYARETRWNGHTLAEEPAVRTKLADRAIELEVARYLAYRIASMQSAGKPFNAEASMAKAFKSEFTQRLANTGMQILGLYGQIRRGSKYAPLQGRIERLYKAAVVGTIAGGSSEIQRNIIAGRGLGLPR